MEETDLDRLLRGTGHRVTAARRLVWDALQSAGGHQTATEIADRVNVADPNVNLSSVYRTLSLFSELELVRESKLGVDGTSSWEPIHSDDHFHLVCRKCGKVDHHTDSVVGRTRDHLAGDHGFQAETIELVATGLCRSCAASN